MLRFWLFNLGRRVLLNRSTWYNFGMRGEGGSWFEQRHLIMLVFVVSCLSRRKRLKAVATANESLHKWLVLFEVGGLDKIEMSALEIRIVELVRLASRVVVPTVVGWPHGTTLFEVELVVLLIGACGRDVSVHSTRLVYDFLLLFEALRIPLDDLLRAKLLRFALCLLLTDLDRLNRHANGAGVLKLNLWVFLPLGSTLVSFFGRSGGLLLFKLILLDFGLQG